MDNTQDILGLTATDSTWEPPASMGEFTTLYAGYMTTPPTETVPGTEPSTDGYARVPLDIPTISIRFTAT